MASFIDLMNKFSSNNVTTTNSQIQNNEEENKKQNTNPIIPINLGNSNQLDVMRKASDKNFMVTVDKELEKYNELGFNYNPSVNVRKTIEENQSNGEKVANGILRTLWSEGIVSIAQSFTEIVDIVNYFATGQKEYNQNDASRYLQGVRDRFNEEHEIYMEEGTNIINGGLGKLSWWMSNMPTIASTLSMMIPSKAVSTIGTRILSPIVKGVGRTAVGAATKVGKTSKAFITFNKKSAQAVEHSSRINAAKEAWNATKWIAPIGKKMNDGINAFIDVGLAAYTSRMLENYQEATQVYNDMYEIGSKHLIDLQRKDSNGDGISDYDDYVNKHRDELLENNIDVTNSKAVAKYIANRSADKTMAIDMWNLGFDVLQMYSLRNVFKNLPKQVSTVAGQRGLKSTLRAVQSTNNSTEQIKSAFWRRIGDKTVDFGKGFARKLLPAASEGLEEAVNYIAQEEGMTYGKALLNNATYDTSGNPLKWAKHIKQYVKDGALYDSMFWGFLGGLAFDYIGDVSGFVKDRKTLKKKHIDGWEGEGLSEGKYQAKTIDNTYRQLQALEGQIRTIKDDTELSDIQKQDAIDEVLKSYITDRTLAHANNGSIDLLTSFIENEDVNKYMSEKFGLSKEDTNNLVTSWKETINSAKDKYNTEITRVIKSIERFDGFTEKRSKKDKVLDFFLDRNEMPLEIAQLIASNNVRNSQLIDEIDKRIADVKAQILGFKPSDGTEFNVIDVSNSLRQDTLRSVLTSLYKELDTYKDAKDPRSILVKKNLQKQIDYIHNELTGDTIAIPLILNSLESYASELSDADKAAVSKLRKAVSGLADKTELSEIISNEDVKRYIALLPKQFRSTIENILNEPLDYGTIGEAIKKYNSNIDLYENLNESDKETLKGLHKRLLSLENDKRFSRVSMYTSDEDIWNAAAAEFYNLNDAFRDTIDKAVKTFEDLYDKVGMEGIDKLVKVFEEGDFNPTQFRPYSYNFNKDEFKIIIDALNTLELTRSNTYKLFDFIRDIVVQHKYMLEQLNDFNAQNNQGEDKTDSSDNKDKNDDISKYEKDMSVTYNKDENDLSKKLVVEEQKDDTTQPNKFNTKYSFTTDDTASHEIVVESEDANNEDLFGEEVSKITPDSKVEVIANPTIVISSTGEVIKLNIGKLRITNGEIVIETNKVDNSVDELKEEEKPEPEPEAAPKINEGEDTNDDAALIIGDNALDHLNNNIKSIIYEEDGVTVKEEFNKLLNDRNNIDTLINLILEHIDYSKYPNIDKSIIECNVLMNVSGLFKDNTILEELDEYDENSDTETRIEDNEKASSEINNVTTLYSSIDEDFENNELARQIKQLEGTIKIDKVKKFINNKVKSILDYVLRNNPDIFKTIITKDNGKTSKQYLINTDDLLRAINNLENNDNKTHKASMFYDVLMSYIKEHSETYILTDNTNNKTEQLANAITDKKSVMESRRMSLVETDIIRVNIDVETHSNPVVAKIFDNLNSTKSLQYKIENGKLVFKYNNVEIGSLTIPNVSKSNNNNKEIVTTLTHVINNIKTEFVINPDGTYSCDLMNKITNIFNSDDINDLINLLYTYAYTTNNNTKTQAFNEIKNNKHIQDLLHSLEFISDDGTGISNTDEENAINIVSLLTNLLKYDNFASLTNENIIDSIKLFFDYTFNNCNQTIKLANNIKQNNNEEGTIDIVSTNNGEIIRPEPSKNVYEPFDNFKYPSKCIITDGKLKIDSDRQVVCYCQTAGKVSNAKDNSKEEIGAFKQGSTFVRLKRTDGTSDFVQCTGSKISDIKGMKNNVFAKFINNVIFNNNSLLYQYLNNYINVINDSNASPDDLKNAYNNIKNLFNALFLTTQVGSEDIYRNILRTKQNYKYNTNNSTESGNYTGFYQIDINGDSIQTLAIYHNMNKNNEIPVVSYVDKKGKRKNIPLTKENLNKAFNVIYNAINEVAIVNINFNLLQNNINKQSYDSYSYCGFQPSKTNPDEVKFVLTYKNVLDDSEPVVYEFDDYNDFLLKNDLIKLNLDYDKKRNSNYNVKAVRNQKNNAYLKINSTLDNEQISQTTSPVEENGIEPKQSSLNVNSTLVYKGRSIPTGNKLIGEKTVKKDGTIVYTIKGLVVPVKEFEGLSVRGHNIGNYNDVVLIGLGLNGETNDFVVEKSELEYNTYKDENGNIITTLGSKIVSIKEIRIFGNKVVITADVELYYSNGDKARSAGYVLVLKDGIITEQEIDTLLNNNEQTTNTPLATTNIFEDNIKSFVNKLNNVPESTEITIDELFNLIRDINGVDNTDENVNKLLNSLKELGLLKNNIIFAKDNETLNKPIKNGGAYSLFSRNSNKILVGMNWFNLINKDNKYKNAYRADAIRRIIHENLHQLINGLNEDSKKQFYSKAKQYVETFKKEVDNDATLTDNQKNSLRKFLTDTLQTNTDYIAEEFIVYALTNKTLSNYLNTIKVDTSSNKPTTLLNKVKELLTNLFNNIKQALNVKPDTLLDDIINNVGFIFDESNQQKQKEITEELRDNYNLFGDIDLNKYSSIEETNEIYEKDNNDIIIDSNSMSLTESIGTFAIRERANLASKINSAEVNMTCR